MENDTCNYITIEDHNEGKSLILENAEDAPPVFEEGNNKWLERNKLGNIRKFLTNFYYCKVISRRKKWLRSPTFRISRYLCMDL